MGSLLPVDVDVVVGKYGTTYGRDAHSLVGDSHLLYYLGYELVHDSVGATRAVVHIIVVQQRWLLVDNVFWRNHVFHCVFLRT